MSCITKQLSSKRVSGPSSQRPSSPPHALSGRRGNLDAVNFLSVAQVLDAVKVNKLTNSVLSTVNPLSQAWSNCKPALAPLHQPRERPNKHVAATASLPALHRWDFSVGGLCSPTCPGSTSRTSTSVYCYRRISISTHRRAGHSQHVPHATKRSQKRGRSRTPAVRTGAIIARAHNPHNITYAFMPLVPDCSIWKDRPQYPAVRWCRSGRCEGARQQSHAPMQPLPS